MRHIWMLAFCLGSIAWGGDEKVVVIGFDGADYRIVEEMLADQELPNLNRLREMGGFKALTPTNPPQTPVSWSTFATGINPGRTGIFDFLRRKKGSYSQEIALNGEVSKQLLLGEQNQIVFPVIAFFLVSLLSLFLLRKKGILLRFGVQFFLAGAIAWAVFFVFSQWIPTKIPGIQTVRKGTPIWKILQDAGKTASVIRLPITFPAEELDGEMVAGLAVPDMRGTVGKPSIYTNDTEWLSGENKFSVEIYHLDGQAPFQTNILGPPNKLFFDAEKELAARRNGIPYKVPSDFTIKMEIQVEGDRVTPIIQGERYPLKAGEWSPWIVFQYEVNPLITLQGFGRFYLERVKDGIFKLYMTPVHPHPSMPLPLSWPPDLAQKLWAEEPYKTMGWALDTWSVGDGLMDEEHFLQDVDLTVTRFEKMMDEFLKDNKRDLYIQVFSFTDRVGHILWRYWDEGHPRYNAEKGAKFQEIMRETYRRMDRIVGRAMDMVDLEKTTFIVCSDHGFSSFRHQFNYNTWLVKNGYMTLRKDVLGEPMKLDDLANKSTPFSFVDWSKTKAYAFGLGMVYINLEGREPEGSVKREEYAALCQQLTADLEAYVDESTGIKPVRKVYTRDMIYKDYDPDETPDLRVATAFNVRVSWDTTLGGMPKDIVEVNPKNWSGDHCSLDPEDVKGILFSSRPIKVEDPQMADLCPSILDLMGVQHGIKMDGRSILK